MEKEKQMDCCRKYHSVILFRNKSKCFGYVWISGKIIPIKNIIPFLPDAKSFAKSLKEIKQKNPKKRNLTL